MLPETCLAGWLPSPYYNDYHVWNNDEVVYYNRWRVKTHRPDVDFRRLRRDDQREYWRWRPDCH
jgi:hypothetical protein